MIVAISAKGETQEAKREERFGRCQYFVLFDIGKNNVTSFANPAASAAGGAGPAAAQELVNRNVNVVITGHVGGNADRALQAAGIRVVETNADTVKEAVEEFLQEQK